MFDKLAGSPLLGTFLLFAIGFAALAAATVVLYVGPDGETSTWAVRWLMAPLGLSLLGLLVRALVLQGRNRWLNVLAAGLLLLMFSAFAILSFGMLTLPVAVVLLVSAGTRLFWMRTPRVPVPEETA